MIRLHRMNGEEFVLNYRHIERIEEKPDTVVTLSNEKLYVVKESADEIIRKIKEYESLDIDKLKA